MLQSELALAAHGGAPSRRRAAPAIDLAAIETPGLSGWERYLKLAEIVGERSARFADAAFVKKLAATYDRAEHLPSIGLLLNWQPGITTGSYYAGMRPETIIVLLRGAILREARHYHETGRYIRSRSFRTLVRRAYLAERLQVLRTRAAKRVAA